MSIRLRIIVPIVIIAAVIGTIVWYQPSQAFLDTSAMRVVPDSAEAFPGGATSVRDTGLRSFGRSPMNMTEDRWRLFVPGKGVFARHWVNEIKGPSPIGPLYSSFSCIGCHVRDGRGRPPLEMNEEPQSMIVRLAQIGPAGARASSPYGEQLDYRATDGATPEGSVQVAYREREVRLIDGTIHQLHEPLYTFTRLAHGPIGSDYRISPRVAPANFGLGLLEAVPAERIIARADPDDRDGDGISGRANYAIDHRSGERRLGRFGWKGAQPTLRQQIAAAFVNDLGITSSLFPDEMSKTPSSNTSTKPELTDDDLDRIEYYVMLTAVPNRRRFNDPRTRHGQAIFNGIGCASCHVPEMRTGVLEGYPEISGQRIFPYTDLLLHDMGEGLADNFPEGEATGREWRTPPLWGIGLIPNINKHTRLLHDGRAHSIEEAILWHGGEGERSMRAFRSLSQSDREALILFLRSI